MSINKLKKLDCLGFSKFKCHNTIALFSINNDNKLKFEIMLNDPKFIVYHYNSEISCVIS